MGKDAKLSSSAALICLAGVSCLLWGSAFPAVKIGYQLFGIDSGDTFSQILFAGCRFFLAGALTLLLYALISRQPPRLRKSELPRMAVLSAFQTLLQYLFFYLGLARTTGVKSSILTASGTFFAVFVSAFIFRFERLNAQKLIGCAFGFAGVVLINVAGKTGFSFRLGDVFMLLSALSNAFAASFSKKFSENSDPVLLSGFQFLFGGAVMVICGLLLGGFLRPKGSAAWFMLLYLAFVSAVAFSLWSLLLKHNEVSKVAVFGFMTPLFGALLSFIILHESGTVSPLQAGFALLLVCAGIIIVQFKGGSKRLIFAKHEKNS